MKYSVKFRIWHWLNAFVIFALFITVGLRETFLNTKTNAEHILAQLTQMSVTITNEQALTIAKVLRDTMWQWHIYLGYVLAALILFRIVLIFKDSSNKDKFMQLNFHKKMVRFSHFAFYLILLAITVSGFVLTFHDLLQIDKDLLHEIKEKHELFFQIILGFVVLHIVGVTISDNKDEKGITSSMINGGEIKEKQEDNNI